MREGKRKHAVHCLTVRKETPTLLLMMKVQQMIRSLLIVLGALIALALVLTSWLSFLDALRVVAGSIYVLIVPGFVWTWVFWRRDALEWIDRIILSSVLSLSVVALGVLLATTIGIRLHLVSVLLEIAAVTLLGGLALWWTTRRAATRQRSHDRPRRLAH